MTAKKLALLHTSPVLAPLFASLCAKWMPETRIFHMVDESLIKNTIEAGHLQRITIRRLIGMIGSGFDAGADAVLVTCSSIGPGVEIAQALFDRPVIRVDEAMAKIAVEQGKRVGVMHLEYHARSDSRPGSQESSRSGTNMWTSSNVCVRALLRPSWRAIPPLMTASSARR